MFNFFMDTDNYEERKVDRFEKDDLIIDTARRFDGRQPYETGIEHPEYNDGRWVIVEAYDTKEEAQVGHNAWVEKMTTLELPNILRDCQNAEISSFADAFGCDMEFPRVITVDSQDIHPTLPE